MRFPAPLRRPAAFAAALALAAGGLLAFNIYPRSSDGMPYKWIKGWTTMKINTYSFPSTSVGNQIVRTAAAPWSNNTQSSFRYILEEKYSTTIGHLDGGNDLYLISLMPYYGLGTLGLTYAYDDTGTLVVYPSTGTELKEADVALDWSYGGYYWYYYDFQSTVTHELGHALGLAHSSDPNAVMGTYAPPLPATNRVLTKDDSDGEAYLYPATPGGGGGGLPPPGPSPKPKRIGSMTGLTTSPTEVFTGDALVFDATISNPTEGEILLSGVETRPVSIGPWAESVLAAGESRPLHLERTVADIPGLYSMFLRIGGQDTVLVYEIQQLVEGEQVRVRRLPVGLPVQDTLAAALGPGGREDVDLWIPKGAKVVIDANFPAAWAGGGRLALTLPSGFPAKFTAGKTFKAKEQGVHRLLVENGGSAEGNYRIFTTASGRAPGAKVKGALAGTGPVEVPFPAAARTGGIVSVKGSKKLGLSITALRSPSGALLPVTAGGSVSVESFGEDGIWTAVVEGVEGAAGKFKLQVAALWTAGEPATY